MKYSKALVTFLLQASLSFSNVNGFVAPAFAPAKRHRSFHKNDFGNRIESKISNGVSAAMIAPLQEISVVSSSNFEVEIFTDLAHLLLDFATLLSPNTLVLRLFILFGRVFSILSDLTPDASITTDEFFFQSFMFTLSSYNFVNTVVPLMLSASQQLSFQDKRMYQSTFRSFGFTWSQYKSLLANGSIEWVDVPPESTLMESKENILITYRGLVRKTRMDSSSKYTEAYGGKNGRCSHDFIGDLSTIKSIVDRLGTSSDQKSLTPEEDSDLQILTTEDRVQLLRVNTDRLLKSAQKDTLVDAVARNLLLSAILSFCEPTQLEITTNDSQATTIPNGTYAYNS